MRHIIVYLKKEVKKNLLDYLLLFTAGIFFVISLNLFKGERTLEFIVLLGFVSFYIIWGIYHHIIEDTLHVKTVIEYILIAFTIIFLLKILILP
jgi:hypothetical protein